MIWSTVYLLYLQQMIKNALLLCPFRWSIPDGTNTLDGKALRYFYTHHDL